MKISGYILLIAVVAAPYVVNFVKLTNCDFTSSYRCEVIHGAGAVVPPLAWITVWFSSDN